MNGIFALDGITMSVFLGEQRATIYCHRKNYSHYKELAEPANVRIYVVAPFAGAFSCEE